MATEINSYARQDVSQSTPIKCSRLILSQTSSRMDSSGQHGGLLARYEVKVTFFHAPASGKIAVIPPRSLVENGCCRFSADHVRHQRNKKVLEQQSNRRARSSHDAHGFSTTCQGDEQPARTYATRWGNCRVSALSYSVRPREQLCTLPSTGHPRSLPCTRLYLACPRLL